MSLRPSNPRRRRLLTTAGKAVTLSAATIGAGLLSGCGFRLRGEQLTLDFERFHTNLSPESTVGGDLRRAVRAAKGQVVEQAREAQVVLQAFPEIEEHEISAFSTTGRPREYTLRLRFRFRLTDGFSRPLSPETEIGLRRRLAVNDALGTFNAEEAALLFRDMRSDLVAQLMRRLASVRLAGSPGGTRS